ncbi:MAG: hypothetical protein NT092_03835, partial [Bacteroidia bacterium]|nr:hypothetical protein [Bacteroidia bacterium]
MKKRIFFLMTIIALSALCVYGQSGKKFFKAGELFMETFKYEDAIAQFTSAIGIEPSNAAYYFARGKAYDALYKNSEAKTDFEKAIVFSPKNVDAHVRLGAICNRIGQYEEALVVLNHATGMDKRSQSAYPEKVKTLFNLEKYDQALKASDTAIIIKDNPMHYYWRGIIYTKLNNDFSARKEFEKCIAKDKKLIEPRLALADLLLKGGDNQGAMAQCNEILKTDDKNTAAYLLRSRVDTANIDFPNAINDISKNILIEPGNPDFYLIRGQYYQKFNQHPNAINDFTKYISLNPNNPDAYFARAKSYKALLDDESLTKAINDYNKITELSEFNQEARKMLKRAQDELYELNRENVSPEITVVNPTPVNETIEIRGDTNII